MALECVLFRLNVFSIIKQVPARRYVAIGRPPIMDSIRSSPCLESIAHTDYEREREGGRGREGGRERARARARERWIL